MFLSSTQEHQQKNQPMILHPLSRAKIPPAFDIKPILSAIIKQTSNLTQPNPPNHNTFINGSNNPHKIT